MFLRTWGADAARYATSLRLALLQDLAAPCADNTQWAHYTDIHFVAADARRSAEAEFKKNLNRGKSALGFPQLAPGAVAASIRNLSATGRAGIRNFIRSRGASRVADVAGMQERRQRRETA